jgi:hypothetical protein
MRRREGRPEPHVEAAHGAAPLVSLKHPLPEGRVTFPPGRTRLQRQADGVQDVRVERLGEVPLKDPADDLADESRVRGQGAPHVGRGASPDGGRPQRAHGGDVIAGLLREVGRGLHDPDAIALEPPEGLFGVVRLPRRAELPQQGGQVRLGLLERDLRLALLPPAQGVEHEQRLVRGTLVTLLPDVQPVKPRQDDVAAHGRTHAGDCRHLAGLAASRGRIGAHPGRTTASK